MGNNLASGCCGTETAKPKDAPAAGDAPVKPQQVTVTVANDVPAATDNKNPAGASPSGDSLAPPVAPVRGRRNSHFKLGKPYKDGTGVWWVFGPTDNIETKYQMGKRLGQPGGFAYTVLATHIETKEERAVKVISKLAQDESTLNMFRQEIVTISRTDHPNIVKFFEVFEDKRHMYVVMEVCKGGELFDAIVAQPGGKFSERDAALLLSQVFEGVKYLHSLGIAHCDLKPDNILFAAVPPKNFSSVSANAFPTLKIIDFGFAKFVQKRKVGKYFSRFCGTPYYTAPEVIERKYTESCDVWSLGVITFVMLQGFPPFYADPNKWGEYGANERIKDQVRKGFDPHVKAGYGPWFPAARPISAEARALIARMLDSDMASRYTVSEALRDPWFQTALHATQPLDPAVLKSLREFDNSNKFKQIFLVNLVDNLSETELQRLHTTFSNMDTDHDKRITLAELKQALASKECMDLKLSPQDSEQLLARADIDANGVIDYTELCVAFMHMKLLSKEERLWQTFDAVDKNKDGRLDANEISAILPPSEREHAAKIVALADTDGDGRVSYEEFLKKWMDGLRNEEALIVLTAEIYDRPDD